MIKDLNEALRLGEASSSPMPMTAGARGIMQIGQNLYGKNARLEDVIRLTEQLSATNLLENTQDDPAGARPISLDDAALTDFEIATVTCNALAVLECVSMGHRFGLSLVEMARILIVGSAWSQTAENLLPPLATGKDPTIGITLGNAQSSLKRLFHRAAEQGTPLLMPMIALGYVQSTIHQFPEQADLGTLVESFGFKR